MGNSKYYNYSLSINGTERKYGHQPQDYLTDVIVSDFKFNWTGDVNECQIMATNIIWGVYLFLIIS